MEPNKTSEQTPQAEPTTPNPASSTPPEQTPQQAQPQPTAQYVITHRSLEGVGGWLAVWVVLFALGAIIFIFAFFAQLSGEGPEMSRVVDLIFTPILAILYVTTIVTIVLRKRIGKWLAVTSLITAGLYSMILALITPAPSVAGLIAGILVLWLVTGLLALYFLKSERVKQTLTR